MIIQFKYTGRCLIGPGRKTCLYRRQNKSEAASQQKESICKMNVVADNSYGIENVLHLYGSTHYCLKSCRFVADIIFFSFFGCAPSAGRICKLLKICVPDTWLQKEAYTLIITVLMIFDESLIRHCQHTASCGRHFPHKSLTPSIKVDVFIQRLEFTLGLGIHEKWR